MLRFYFSSLVFVIAICFFGEKSFAQETEGKIASTGASNGLTSRVVAIDKFVAQRGEWAVDSEILVESGDTQKKVDIGGLWTGGRFKARVKLVNQTGVDKTIKELRPDCGCVGALVNSPVFLNGSVCTLMMVFETNHLQQLRRKIDVVYDDGSLLELQILGNIRERFSKETLQLPLSIADIGLLFSPLDETLTISAVKCASGRFKVVDFFEKPRSAEVRLRPADEVMNSEADWDEEFEIESIKDGTQQNVTCLVKVVVAKRIKISPKLPVFLLDENYWEAQVIVSFPEVPKWESVKFTGVLEESQRKFDCDFDVVSVRGRIGVLRLKIPNTTFTSFESGLLVTTCGGIVSDPFHFKFGRSK